MDAWRVGDRVTVDDPSWDGHGTAGTVVKVNRKTIRIKADDGSIIVGGHVYFKEEEEHDAR